MAQDPLKPKESTKIGLPAITPGMNKLPGDIGTGKGGKGDDRPLGRDKEEEDDAKILERIRKRFERCIQAESENRKAAVEDLKFKVGEQWPADVQAQRNLENRPCLTLNVLPTYINQVVNDQRQNRPTINISPVGERGDKDAAKMFRGLIRAIERQSKADIAYDTAFDSAVSCGFGYIRILTEYESPDSFDQTIVIKRIRNRFTVYLDPDHQEPDGCDCRFGFVTDIIPHDEFREEHPDATPLSFDQGGQGEKFKNWTSKDGIRIAEYFEIKHEMRDLVKLSNGHEGWKDELADGVLDKYEIVAERKSAEPKVKWYKVTALEILERQDWLGQWIPIVPVIGNEEDIEGKVKLSGVIRFAKDAQRMRNYWKTAETEAVALAPKAPFVGAEGQFEGHERQWRQANKKSFPYLQYKPTTVSGQLVPPPQRQPAMQVPAAIVEAAQGAAQDIMATTGIRFDPSGQGVEPDHRESGRMLREQRRNADLGTSHYTDNLSRSLHHVGRQLLDLIPKVYDEKRVLTILREDDTEEQIELNPHANKPYAETKDPQTGKTRKIFNPKAGKYGVTVTIGPSYATRRIEAAESMMEFAKALPNVAALIADLIAKNQDWEGAEEMATRLAKAVPPQLMTPDQKDIPPQVQAVIQNLEMQAKQLQQQLAAALKEVHEKEEDRQVARDKINADFEVKLLGILQKAQEHADTHHLAKVDALISGVERMMTALSPPDGGQSTGSAGQGEAKNG